MLTRCKNVKGGVHISDANSRNSLFDVTPDIYRPYSLRLTAIFSLFVIYFFHFQMKPTRNCPYSLAQVTEKGLRAEARCELSVKTTQYGKELTRKL